MGSSFWNSYTLTTTSKTITGLIANTTYQWRVLTGCQQNPLIKSPYTDGANFKTASAITAKNNAITQETFHIQITPNPVKSFATIVVKGNIFSYDIILSDLSGRILWRKEKVTSTHFIIPVDNLLNGIYYVKVKNSEKMKTIKLIKQK